MTIITMLRIAVLVQQLKKGRDVKNELVPQNLSRLGVEEKDSVEAMQLIAEIEPWLMAGIFDGLAHLFVRDDNGKKEENSTIADPRAFEIIKEKSLKLESQSRVITKITKEKESFQEEIRLLKEQNEGLCLKIADLQGANKP